ncbi:hypothetical protein DFH08DRAFT_827236 [Mycena albidolilacea]|uniref:Uncharacterized protein n=1 Tax=Mycena albidolilacea TaxID=1033008 RepID=A0AAD6YYL8_9AGAR|nr:hypothetical protein DFH08DRAFT_827236 [Mycena albidolilacea]
MYGNNDYGLYLPADLETTRPEQELNRNFHEGLYPDSSAQGSGTFSQNTGHAYPHTIPTLGLGPPSYVFSQFPMHNENSSMIQVPSESGMAVPSRSSRSRPLTDTQCPYSETPTQFMGPDIATLLAKMTMRQDHLDQENQLLKRDNNALHARISSFENRPTPVAAPPPSDTVPDPRMAAAARKKEGRGRARKERGVPAAAPLPPVPEIDTPTSGTGAPQQNALQIPVYLGSAKLPPELLPVRTATQKFVSRVFREVCGVGKKGEWPDSSIIRVKEITQEQYLTPRFDGLITDASNQYLISVVARKAEMDLLVHHMVENSFTNFGPQWRRQNNSDLAASNELNLRVGRWKQRRYLKIEQKLSILRTFVAKHGLDLNLLIKLLDEAHESDEASGPEADSGESQETWKARMAALLGIRVTSRAALDKLEFLEVLGADWRSDEWSQLALSSQERERTSKYICVRETGRSSSRIPDLAPWDFGISVPWLKEAHALPENKTLLADWKTYGNPARVDNTFFDMLARIDHNADDAYNADNDDDSDNDNA